MIRRIIKPHITIAVSNWCRTSVPVRYYPRRRLPLPPQNADYDTGDAFDESDITSEIERMENDFQFSNKQIEREKQRQWMKNKILQRKYFKEPQDLNLLSWTAKEQIRYLHQESPEDWTVQKLAQSFPVSEKGIIKILKSDIIVYSQQDIDRHDQRVRKNWQQIQQQLNEGNVTPELQGGPIAQTVKHLAETNKLALMINAGGMEDISLPTRKKTNRKQKIGIFEALVKDYVESSERIEKDVGDFNSKQLLNTISNFQVSSIKERSEENELEDEKSRTENIQVHSHTQVSRRQRRIIHKGESGSLRLEDSHMDNLALCGTGRISDSSEMRSGGSDFLVSKRIRDKERRERLEVMSKIRFDNQQSGREEIVGSDGYIYDTKSGYQYPMGKVDQNLDRIEVPKSRNKKGDLYVQGKYVYDEDGEFLYKIP